VSRPIEMDLGVNAVVTELLWYYAVHCTAVGVWMCVLLHGFQPKSIFAGRGVTLTRKGQASHIAAEYVRIRNINRNLHLWSHLVIAICKARSSTCKAFDCFLLFATYQKKTTMTPGS